MSLSCVRVHPGPVSGPDSRRGRVWPALGRAVRWEKQGRVPPKPARASFLTRQASGPFVRSAHHCTCRSVLGGLLLSLPLRAKLGGQRSVAPCQFGGWGQKRRRRQRLLPSPVSPLPQNEHFCELPFIVLFAIHGGRTHIFCELRNRCDIGLR